MHGTPLLRSAARHGGQASLFRFFNRFEQGKLAGRVEVHADAQIDFGGPCVGVEGFVQSENRVAGRHFYGGKDRCTIGRSGEDFHQYGAVQQDHQGSFGAFEDLQLVRRRFQKER